MHYPFHNILHQKISEIFLTLLAKASSSKESPYNDCDHEQLISDILDRTDLVKTILSTSQKEGGSHFTFK